MMDERTDIVSRTLFYNYHFLGLLIVLYNFDARTNKKFLSIYTLNQSMDKRSDIC